MVNKKTNGNEIEIIQLHFRFDLIICAELKLKKESFCRNQYIIKICQRHSDWSALVS